MDKLNAKVFMKVVETGNFHRAAEELGYTQAGISYIIAAMEEEIGMPLFLRGRAGASLTMAGRELLPQIHRRLLLDQEIEETITELQDFRRGTLWIAGFPSVSICWLPGMVKFFHDDYPDIHIEIFTEQDTRRAEKMILSGEIDCAFTMTRPQGSVIAHELMQEEIFAAVPPEFAVTQRETFPLSELGDYPYIAMRYDATDHISEIFEKNGTHPNAVFTMDNIQAAMAMADKGFGFSMTSELLLQYAPKGLKIMSFDEPQYRSICLAARPAGQRSRTCSMFMDYACAWVDKNVRSMRIPD